MTSVSIDDVAQLQDELLKSLDRLRDMRLALMVVQEENEMLKRDLSSAARSYKLAVQEIELLRETVASHEGSIYALGGRP